MKKQKEEKDFWDKYKEPLLESSLDESKIEDSSLDKSSFEESNLGLDNVRGDNTLEGLGDNGRV